MERRSSDKQYSFEQKRDSNKRNKTVCDRTRPLNVIKAHFNSLTSCFSGSSDSSTGGQENQPDVGKDKAQQSEVGSSSDSSRIVDIPENFKQIGGNTELAKAQVILLGEAHIPQHHRNISDFIHSHAKDGDIVLVEGVQAGEEKDKNRYVVEEARIYAKRLEYGREINIKFFDKNIKFYG